MNYAPKCGRIKEPEIGLFFAVARAYERPVAGTRFFFCRAYFDRMRRDRRGVRPARRCGGTVQTPRASRSGSRSVLLFRRGKQRFAGRRIFRRRCHLLFEDERNRVGRPRDRLRRGRFGGKAAAVCRRARDRGIGVPHGDPGFRRGRGRHERRRAGGASGGRRFYRYVHTKRRDLRIFP